MTPEQREEFIRWLRDESAFWQRRFRETNNGDDHRASCLRKIDLFEAAIKEFTR